MSQHLESVTEYMLNSTRLFMLSLISSSTEKGWLGITKLQKLSFLIDYFLSINNKRVLGYDFYMYDHGPISTEVYDDFEFLLNEEIISEGESGIKLTTVGINMAKDIDELIPNDVKIITKKIVNVYAPLSTHDLVQSVHEMKIKLPNGELMKVDDIPKTCTVLKSEQNAFKLDDDILETFRIKCNTDLMETIKKARKETESRPYEPLVSS